VIIAELGADMKVFGNVSQLIFASGSSVFAQAAATVPKRVVQHPFNSDFV
jgi:hypothetical protein